MLCPSCGRILNKIEVTTRQGGKFDVDHCGYCGGTWFDPYEINRIPFHEVVHLASLTVLPNIKTTKNATLLCPNDHHELEKFAGDAVPAKVSLLWCKKCLGIWATQKDLVEFKKHQEETISAYDEGSKFFPSLSVIFIPALTFLFLLALTFSTISNLQEARESRIFAESQISGLNFQTVSGDTAILNFNTTNTVKSSISYGITTLDLKEIVISPESSTTHNIILTGLDPASNYLYRLILTDENGVTFTSDLKYFSTK